MDIYKVVKIPDQELEEASNKQALPKALKTEEKSVEKLFPRLSKSLQVKMKKLLCSLSDQRFDIDLELMKEYIFYAVTGKKRPKDWWDFIYSLADADIDLDRNLVTTRMYNELRKIKKEDAELNSRK